MPRPLKHINKPQFLRYAVVGVLAYGVALGLMWIFANQLAMNELFAYAITQVVILCMNFIITRHWVFASLKTKARQQFLSFVVTSLVFRLLNWLLFTLSWTVFELPREVCILAALAVIFPIKYWVHKVLVFGHPTDLSGDQSTATCVTAPDLENPIASPIQRATES